MQVCPTFHTYPKTPLKAFSGRIWKRRQIPNDLVRFHTHWAIERIIWGIYVCFTKLIKPLDRWLIEEWMIGDSVINVLSCNRSRTWKAIRPTRDQGNGWIKISTCLNCKRILCYRHDTCELYQHSRNSWSTTKYLAICLGRAKVKLGGFVGGH
jgi:hypothetical protein